MDGKISIGEATALVLLALITDASILLGIILLLVPIVGEVFGAGVVVLKFTGDAFYFIYFWMRTGQFGRNALVQGGAALLESYGVPTTTFATIAGIYLANHPEAAFLGNLLKGKVSKKDLDKAA